MNGIYLSRLPLSGKVFCTLFLVGIGCGALAAFTQAATAVGLSPADVQASLAPAMPMTPMGHGQMMGEKEITMGEISSAAKVWIRTPLLIQTSHTHLFGQTLIAGLLGLIFLFSSLREGAKALILALPFGIYKSYIRLVYAVKRLCVAPGAAAALGSGRSRAR